LKLTSTGDFNSIQFNSEQRTQTANANNGPDSCTDELGEIPQCCEDKFDVLEEPVSWLVGTRRDLRQLYRNLKHRWVNVASRPHRKGSAQAQYPQAKFKSTRITAIEIKMNMK
jgi:hypothetical protein